MENQLFETMRDALAQKYVKSLEIARILALAVQSRKNVLLWGPGGHGKSEMVQLALSLVTDFDNIFIQSFGEGMDEATLWGGLDFARLERDKILHYFPEQSFLAKPYAVFEEIFDAPASVLLALKDTLTARILRKGSQTYPMGTKVIIAITNKDPKEMSELGPAAAALIERFPLQLCVKWPSYLAADYLELFDLVGPGLPGANLNGTTKILAEVMAKASEKGTIVSPRTAVHALGIVKAAAAMRRADHVDRQDLLDLCFLPGMEQFAQNLKAELDAAYERSEAEARVRTAEARFQELLQELDEAKAAASPIKLLQVAKRFTGFGDVVSALKVTDGLTERRKKLRESVNEKGAEASKLALDNTRI